jgi:hypothetical protein
VRKPGKAGAPCPGPERVALITGSDRASREWQKRFYFPSCFRHPRWTILRALFGEPKKIDATTITAAVSLGKTVGFLPDAGHTARVLQKAREFKLQIA